MDWGKQNRLSRIIKPASGKAVMLAVDHGYFMGPTTGLEKLDQAVNPLLPYADTLMLTRGALRYYIDPRVDVPITLRVSGGTSILNKETLLHEGIVCSMEEAVRLNVSCVAFSILVGAEYERDTILGFTEIVDEAAEYGIPTLCVTAVGREMARDARYMSLASRLGAELGADIIKTYFVPGFEKVVETCPVPVVIAGGKKIPEKDALQMARNAIDAGAVGVDMGRNIFQSVSPVAMIQAVRAVVHKKATVKEALEVFKSAKAKQDVREAKARAKAALPKRPVGRPRKLKVVTGPKRPVGRPPKAKPGRPRAAAAAKPAGRTAATKTTRRKPGRPAGSQTKARAKAPGRKPKPKAKAAIRKPSAKPKAKTTARKTAAAKATRRGPGRPRKSA